MKNQIKNLEMKVGLTTSLALIAYFLFMKLIDLIEVVELRGLNLLILAAGVSYAYYYERKQTHSNIEYFRGLLLGIFTALYAIIPFSLFVLFYFWKIDPDLIHHLVSHTLFMGITITPEIAAETVLIEGITSGVLLSFILMQYYREGFNDPIKKEEGVER
jgi:uncharacterized protein DUF4199